MTEPTIHPHELGMAVRIRTDRFDGAHYDGQIGVIDEIAAYRITAHGIDFEGWDALVGFHNGGSHAYCAFYFDELEIVPGSLAELIQQRDELGTKAQIFQEQRDGAIGSMRSFGDALKRISDTWLIGDPGNPGWNLVSSAARQLLGYAGPSRDMHLLVDEHAVCGYGKSSSATERHHFLRGTPFETDDITCAACRAYIAGLRAGRNHTR